MQVFITCFAIYPHKVILKRLKFYFFLIKFFGCRNINMIVITQEQNSLKPLIGNQNLDLHFRSETNCNEVLLFRKALDFKSNTRYIKRFNVKFNNTCLNATTNSSKQMLTCYYFKQSLYKLPHNHNASLSSNLSYVLTSKFARSTLSRVTDRRISAAVSVSDTFTVLLTL